MFKVTIGSKIYLNRKINPICVGEINKTHNAPN